MRNKSSLIQQSLSFRVGFGLAALTCALAFSGQAKAEERRSFHFETSCGSDGGGSLTISEGYSAAADDVDYPPELAKCLVFGNQDRARYICLCADREEAITGQIDGASIPSIEESSRPGPEGSERFNSFSKMCRDQFSKACGPFPEPIEVACANEAAECMMSVRGGKRDAGYDRVYGQCALQNGTGWSIHQVLKGDFAIDQAGLQSRCEASLAAFVDENADADFLDVQNQAGDQFSSQSYSCAHNADGRSDDCWVSASETGDWQQFECDCSGNKRAGRTQVRLDESASALRKVCESALDSCKGFEPKKPEMPDGWPDDWDKDKPADPNQTTGGDEPDDNGGTGPRTGGPLPDSQEGNDPGADIKDAAKWLGCRAALRDEEGLPTILGFGALVLLGRLRRRK